MERMEVLKDMLKTIDAASGVRKKAPKGVVAVEVKKEVIPLEKGKMDEDTEKEEGCEIEVEPKEGETKMSTNIEDLVKDMMSEKEDLFSDMSEEDKADPMKKLQRIWDKKLNKAEKE